MTTPGSTSLWIVYGLLAATSFGVAAILQKLAARSITVPLSTWGVLFFQGLTTVVIGAIGLLAAKLILTRGAVPTYAWVLIGGVAVALGVYLISVLLFTKLQVPAYVWAILTGATLAAGSYFIFLTYRAASDANADASRIQALINTNTLIAVILGLVLLKEYTHLHTAADWGRLILGAILVVAGGVLVSWPPDAARAATARGEKSERITVVHHRATHAHVPHRTPQHVPSHTS